MPDLGAPLGWIDILHRHGRAAEWLSSLAILLLGLSLLLPGETMATSPSYRGFVTFGLADIQVGILATAISGTRIIALYANGRWRRSPGIRAVGAVLGTAFWACVVTAFAWPYWTDVTDAPTTALAYFSFVLADLISAYRSGGDARMARR